MNRGCTFHQTCGATKLFQASNPSGIARVRKGRCNNAMSTKSRQVIYGSRIRVRRFARRARVRKPRKPSALPTAPKRKHGRSRWKAMVGQRNRLRRSGNVSMAATVGSKSNCHLRNNRQHPARCHPPSARYADLETRRFVPMPFLRNASIQATAAPDQADPRARGRALRLGASGR